MAGQHLMEYLKDPASFHDEAVRKAFEAKVSKHDNEQLASALMNSLPVEIAELLRLTHGTTATGGTQLISGFTILDYLWTPYVGLQATTYDHRQDTASVEQPKLIPQCDQDLHAALLFWQNALRKLKAAHMAPAGFKLLDGLRKLSSKLTPEFRQMLTQAEYNDKCNGKHWTYVELLAHLHRHAAEALQYPRPANATALFASVDTTPDQVGFVARSTSSSTCYNWLRNSCPGAVCPNGYAHPPSEQGDINKLPQCELFLAGKCYRTRCGFKHGEQAATALVAIPTHTKPDGTGGKAT